VYEDIMATPVSASLANLNSASSTAAAAGVSRQTIAGNFDTFLLLLTTQLKNQNPLDPLDTNQFTQQIVQFAQVEQQLKANDQLATLVSLQKTAQATAALGFVGQSVVVDGSTAQLANGRAIWSFTSPKPALATVNIKDTTGQVVYSTNYSMAAGPQNLVWDGRGNNGSTWPDGVYTISIVAKDTSGQQVAISTEAQGVVDAVDLSQDPPQLLIGGQNYPLDKIKRFVRN